MEAIKVNEKTHSNLIELNRVISQAQGSVNIILTTLDIPQGWLYNPQARQFEPSKQNGEKPNEHQL